MIDMHVHTTASDGRNDLDMLILEAKIKHVTDFVITDHDTINAWREENLKKTFNGLGKDGVCRERGNKTFRDRFFVEDTTIYQGEEVTCYYRGIEVHLLAYGLDEETVDNSELGLHNSRIANANVERVRVIVERLRSRGYEICFEDFEEIVPCGLTRELVAKVLLAKNRDRLKQALSKKGHNGEVDVDAVRNIILGKRSFYYAPISDFYGLSEKNEPAAFPTMERMTKIIIDECKSKAVLAHESKYGISSGTLIKDFAKAAEGRGGLEVWYKQNTERVDYLIKEAHKHHLFCTAGNDYHGEEGNELGVAAASEGILTHVFPDNESI